MRAAAREILPYLTILVLAAAFTAGARLGHHEERRGLKAVEARMTEEVMALREEVRLLERRLRALDEGDPFVVEKQVRDRFGLLRPGEVVIPSSR